jgi:HK97 gp10 family phage protein
MKGSFQLKGLDVYLEEIARAGEDVDKVATEVLSEAAPVARDRMEAILRNTSEQWTGETAASLFAGPVQQDGNYIFFELGADTREELAGLYKEFGNTRQAAEPFLRPALTELRRTGIKKMLKQLMERMGIATT